MLTDEERVLRFMPKSFLYKFTNVQITSDDAYSFEVRCDIPTGDVFAEWLKTFERLSNTTWIITKRTVSVNKSTYAFLRNYKCEHRKKDKGREKFEHCPATLSARIKPNTADAQKSDVFLRIGLFALIKVDFNHSHPVIGTINWKGLRFSKKTRAAFMDYFKNGLSPIEARKLHKFLMMLDGDDRDDRTGSMSNPTKEWVHYLHKNWPGSTVFDLNRACSIVRFIAERKAQFEEEGCAVYMQEHPLCVSIVTPLMSRALQSLEAHTSLYVDSYESNNKMQSSMTIVFVSTKAGAVPLGFSIHDSQSECSYRTVFYGLQALWEAIQPPEISNFITVDVVALKNALTCVWPEAGQLLFEFDVSHTVWRWLWNPAKQLLNDERLALIKCFCQAMSADGEGDFNQDQLMQIELYPEFGELIVRLKERRLEWSANKIVDNIAEVTVRILKDIIVTHAGEFSPIALMDFVFRILEEYYSSQLLDVANGTDERKTSLLQMWLDKGIAIADRGLICQIDEQSFVVGSTKHSLGGNHVVPDVRVCSCISGLQGAFCRHRLAVHLFYGIPFLRIPELSSTDKCKLCAIAVGASNVLTGFCQPPASESEIAQEIDTKKRDPVVKIEMPSEIGASSRDALLQKLLSQMDRFSQILRANTNDEALTKSATIFFRMLENVNTPSELKRFMEAC